MRIEKDKSIAIVIDIQEKLIPHITNNDILIKNTGILLEGLKILNVPLIFTQQYTKGLGKTINEISNFISNENDIIEKLTFSCCKEGKFLDKLLPLNPEFAIICGIESHICVLQTAIDLVEYNIKPIIVADCISSRKEKDHQIALQRLSNEGCIITTYESLLFELCITAGNDTFKKLSTLVK